MATSPPADQQRWPHEWSAEHRYTDTRAAIAGHGGSFAPAFGRASSIPTLTSIYICSQSITTYTMTQLLLYNKASLTRGRARPEGLSRASECEGRGEA
jgi:hypothetical protein